MEKRDIIRILDEMGTLLELQGANPFKSRAFHNASRAVEGLTQDLSAAVASGAIRNVKGVGESIARIITELATAGKSNDYDELRKGVPDGVMEMLRIQGLGPKKVKVLFEKLKITTIDDLEGAARDGTLAGLEGFGKKSEDNILTGIQALRVRSDKTLYPPAEEAGTEILERIRKTKGVVRADIAGSLRRRKEVIGDIDIVASAADAARPAIMETFVTQPGVQSVLAQGDTKSSVVLGRGITCDLRIVRESEFPFALNYFTGSKEHNVEMRSRARRQGLSLNEYGFSPVEEGGKNAPKIQACKEEKDIYRALGLAYVPPELRENMGEIEAAAQDALPDLIKESDIHGTLHCHSTYSDGVNTIEEMARGAQALGWEYLGIADHSKSAAYAGGLSPARVREQVREIDALNRTLKGFTVFKGTECDILADGSLDWPESTLKLFDYVVVSVHSQFRMSEADMTKRIITALKHPAVTMLGHPTGRLLLTRDPYPVDMVRVIDAAAEYGKAIEINANPMRFDLDWRLCKYARERGVRIFINPDAHSIDGLRDTFYGVGIARKGWLGRADVVNAWTTDTVRSYLSNTTR